MLNLENIADVLHFPVIKVKSVLFFKLPEHFVLQKSCSILHMSKKEIINYLVLSSDYTLIA